MKAPASSQIQVKYSMKYLDAKGMIATEEKSIVFNVGEKIKTVEIPVYDENATLEFQIKEAYAIPDWSKLPQTISATKLLNLGFTLQELKYLGYSDVQLNSSGVSNEDIQYTNSTFNTSSTGTIGSSNTGISTGTSSSGSSTGEIGGAIISSAGTEVKPSFTIEAYLNVYYLDYVKDKVALSAQSNGTFAVTWADGLGTSQDVFVRTLKNDGTLLGTSKTNLTNTTYDQFQPNISTFGGTTDKYLITYSNYVNSSQLTTYQVKTITTDITNGITATAMQKQSAIETNIITESSHIADNLNINLMSNSLLFNSNDSILSRLNNVNSLEFLNYKNTFLAG